MISPLICPYCNKPAELVTGAVIYPRRPDLAAQIFHRCEPCDAYVGSHKAGTYIFRNRKKVVSDGSLPFGRLANAELRRAKMRAHEAFDPMWRGKEVPRWHAYKWLSEQLGMALDDTHIGELNIEQCARVVEVCNARASLQLT